MEERKQHILLVIVIMFFAQGASPSVMQNCEKVHVERIENLLVNQNYDLKPTEMEKWDSSH